MSVTLLVSLLKYVVPYWIINTGLNIFQFVPLLKKRDYPLDLKRKFFDHRRILGDSTTFLGLIVAICVGIGVELFLTNWEIGFIKGLCAFFGHAIGSFIKRRLNVPDGSFLIFVDHLDYIIFSGVVFYLFRLESLMVILLSIPLVFIVHPLLCLIGYKLHLRKNKL